MFDLFFMLRGKNDYFICVSLFAFCRGNCYSPSKVKNMQQILKKILTNVEKMIGRMIVRGVVRAVLGLHVVSYSLRMI